MPKTWSKSAVKTKFSKHIPFLIAASSILLFVTYKLTNLVFHFGDGNAYFYMAEQILQGQLPYRNFLLADPPLLIFLLAGFKLIIAHNLILFQAIPVLIQAVNAYLVWLVLNKWQRNQHQPQTNPTSLKQKIVMSFAPGLYLFSFLILSTSDYLTGLGFVILFINLATYWLEKPKLSGFFWALACLIKLYAAPGLLALMLINFLQKKPKKWWLNFIISGLITSLIILGPFLITSYQQVFQFLIVHQFNRPTGINKLKIFKFFLEKDLILIITALVSIALNFRVKGNFGLKNKASTQSQQTTSQPQPPYLKLAWLIPAAWIFFYLIFKDLYYLYLGILTPWLIIYSFSFLDNLLNQLHLTWPKLEPNLAAALGLQLTISWLILAILWQLFTFSQYHQRFRLKGSFPHVNKVANFVDNLPTDYPLYGSHEVAPLVALLTNRSLFNQQIDTNGQLFASQALNKNQLSQQAAQRGVYLMTKVANFKQNQKIDSGHQAYFSETIFAQACQRLTIIDGPDYELIDDIAIYQCSTNAQDHHH